MTLLPWHAHGWEWFERARNKGAIPHALLLEGAPGAGGHEFARFLAASLLCSAPRENYFPCLDCKPCHLYAAGNHTDLMAIRPEEQGKQIKVEQIRLLIEFIALKSRFAGYKVVIISPAEAMNRNAANALLKTLEEPPPLSLLLLVSHRPEALPVTIRSRCQCLRFNPDFSPGTHAWLVDQIHDAELAAELLVHANGAPLTALEMFQNNSLDHYRRLLADLERMNTGPLDPVKTAGQWNAMGAEQVLLWLLQLFTEALKSVAAAGGGQTRDPAMQLRWLKLTNRPDLYTLMTCYDLLLRNYRLCIGQVTHDTQGLLEEFIIHWQQQMHFSGEQPS